MKKIIAILVLCLISVFSLVGCNKTTAATSDADLNVQFIHSEYFDCVVVEDLGGGCMIIADKNSGVLYLIVGGYSSCAMTPILNTDGTPKLLGE